MTQTNARPSYSPQTIISAADMLQALGHSGFDRFLMELDLPDSTIGVGGGLMARATSLAGFAIKNPEFLSPERRTVAYEIVLRAVQIWKEKTTNNLGSGERNKFVAAMKREGLSAQLTDDEAPAGFPRFQGMSSGTADTNVMTEENEWISAASAVALLGMGPYGRRVICRRAHAGLIKARAERLLRGGKVLATFEIFPGFWWAKGEAALNQNWTTGDFDTWIDHKFHLEAFGVTFRRSDIERAKPSPAQHEEGQTMTSGKHIFIGHGRSQIWRELKDFLEDRLGLSVDEFNRTATAGVATANRLEEMLSDAAFAFLVLTAEDEQLDGTITARFNVIHEAGLFQGKLGFKRAILMLEDGCNEFSNIHGLGQLRFPKGRISAEFEEIRRVLEREKIIVSS